MTNKELIEIANMELRDQLEAKDWQIKKLKEQLKKYRNRLEKALEICLIENFSDKAAEQLSKDIKEIDEALNAKKA